MIGIYTLLIGIGIASLLGLIVAISERDIFWGLTSFLLVAAFLATGISGNVWEDNKKYAKEEFVSGIYTVDTQAVIKNCGDKADSLAVNLIDENINTCYIEPNIGRRDIEFVCTIPKEGEDIRVYVELKDIQTMLSNNYIKLVTE